MIWNDIFLAMWFFLPVGVANSAPVFAAAIPALSAFDYPMDFYATFRGKRVFGSHKTFRGLVAGTILGVLVILLQQYLYIQIPWIRQHIAVDYTTLNPVLFGFLCALGALLGDAIKSFFKRQIGVKPGKTWFPFDQTDYIIGGILFTAVYRPLPFVIYAWIVGIWFGLHLLSTWLGYVIGLKDAPI